MRPLARILVDESHRPAWSTRPGIAVAMNPVNPADASYAIAAEAAREAGFTVDVHAEGPLDDAALGGYDAVVLLHGSDDAWERTTGTGTPRLADAEIDAIERFVAAGGGLVALGETEQDKYGNNLAEVVRRFGIALDNVTVQDPLHAHRDVPTWVLADLVPGVEHDLTVQVDRACFYRAGALRALTDGVRTIARTSADADPARAPLVLASTCALGRVVVTADSDIFGDDSITDLDHRQLWLNLITWVAGSRACAAVSSSVARLWTTDDPAWHNLVEGVTTIRVMQDRDGSIDTQRHSAEQARGLVERIVASIHELAPRFPHQAEHLAATITDLERWAAGGFGTPDFVESLRLFRPDLHRAHGVEHLAVFPMYTQNGNPDRNLEAVVTRTFWPDWLAEQERTYDNAAFVPIEFVGFTPGYDTHSAVFFPETVAASETIDFHWGGIFCDREAARFRAVVQEASSTLHLALPPDLDLLLHDQALAQETFVLWDLIHDRTHSRGDLPFDPFMIKQRMPYWMYALEELRCDLATYRQTLALDADGVHLGRFIRLAIVLDRLFRFTISGTRVRNYDGLGGQIIFAWLHRGGVLRWTDNTLSIDWSRLTPSMLELCEAVEDLYRGGIDRSRVAQWLVAHQFVSALVEPHPSSVWARGADALPVAGSTKELVDAVLPDEFPLNVFFEALQRRLAPTIDATAGLAPMVDATAGASA